MYQYLYLDLYLYLYLYKLVQDPAGTQGHPEGTQDHPGPLRKHPGPPRSDAGAQQRHPGTPRKHPGPPRKQPGATQVPGSTEASPREHGGGMEKRISAAWRQNKGWPKLAAEPRSTWRAPPEGYLTPLEPFSETLLGNNIHPSPPH